MWINRPFLPGIYNDIKIFRSALKQKLEKAGEKTEADSGYKGELGTIRHQRVYVSESDKRAKAISRSRHETINRRMKKFCCLSSTYCHD